MTSTKRALPVLEDIRVASPCTMRWDDMVGGERVRFCAACQKNVFNLESMTRKEAVDLIAGTEGRVCARFYRRADGTVLTADCPVGIRMAARRARRALGGALAASLSAVAALVALLGAAPMLRGLRALPEPTPSSATTSTYTKTVLVPMKADAGEEPKKKPRVQRPEPPPMPMMGDVAFPETDEPAPQP